MFFRNLCNQFLHDLKANWQKSALLGVLFVIGLFFWIPPLYRAVAGRTPTAPVAKAPATAAIPVTTKTPRAAGSKPAPRNVAGSGQPDRFDVERRRRDPLVQSVDPSAIRTDPFHIDLDQFSPPVVFVKEPKVSKPQQKTPVAKTPPHLPDGLVLRSTIVGASRRAAFINRKLYFPGMDVRFDGEVYRLIAVHARRVVLRRDSVDFDLTIRKHNSLNTGERPFNQPTGASTPPPRPSL